MALIQEHPPNATCQIFEQAEQKWRAPAPLPLFWASLIPGRNKSTPLSSLFCFALILGIGHVCLCLPVEVSYRKVPSVSALWVLGTKLGLSYLAVSTYSCQDPLQGDSTSALLEKRPRDRTPLNFHSRSISEGPWGLVCPLIWLSLLLECLKSKPSVL